MFLGCPSDACPARYREASPLTHVDDDSAPMLVANSRAEVIPVADATALIDELESSGVPHELRLLDGSRHGRHYAEDVLEATDRFLRSHVGDLDGDDTGRVRGRWLVAAVVVGTIVVGAALVGLLRRWSTTS